MQSDASGPEHSRQPASQRWQKLSSSTYRPAGQAETHAPVPDVLPASPSRIGKTSDEHAPCCAQSWCAHEAHCVERGPTQVSHVEWHAEHSRVYRSAYSPSGHLSTQPPCERKACTPIESHAEHSEANGPTHSRQVESHGRHSAASASG